MRSQLLRWSAGSRCQKADSYAVMQPDEAHRLRDVAVVGYYDRAVVGLEPSVIQEMDGKVDVRALLLGLGRP